MTALKSKPAAPNADGADFVCDGEDDQVVPIGNSAHKAIELLSNGTLKTYEGLSHGFLSTHPDLVNPDLLAFVRS